MPPAVVEKRKPRYQEIAEELRQQILGGEFPRPDQFPTETVLCARYGVSRFTVREALRRLQNEELIQRRRGSGTVIQPAAARGGALHQPLSNVGEILQYARDTRFVFAREGSVPLPRRIAADVGIDVAGLWAHFRGLRTRHDDQQPLAFTDAYIHPELAEVADAIDPTGTTIFRQLERLAGLSIAQVTQEIQAVPATSEVAAALGLRRGRPCLRILRCYCDGNGRIVEISASHHPGESFVYSMHIEVGG